MATISQIVAQIRTAIFGKDVRENIAQGIEQINQIAESAESAVSNKVNYSDIATVTETKTYLEIP